MDWQAVSAASYVHALLSTDTVDPGPEDNSFKIKSYAKRCLQNAEGTLINEVIVLLKT